MLQADRHQPSEDGRQEVGRLDVDAEPVGPHLGGVGHDVLEDAGLEVPAGGVQPGGVGAERVEHLLHLVRGGQRLDQRDRADHVLVADAQVVPAEVEEVAPEARLLGGLHLRQVEVQPLPARHLRPSAVEHGERRAKDRGGDGLTVDGHLGLVEVQPSLAVHEEWQLAVLNRVVAASRLVVVLQRPVDRSEPIAGRRNGVDQAVTRRVFIVVEVADRALTLRAGIQRVDEHVGDRRRPRDLDAGTPQVLRDGRNAPIGGVDLRDGRVRGHDAVF